MKLIENILEMVDLYLPFNPEIPVELIIPIIANEFSSFIGQDLILLIHLGSTAQTPANLSRVDYKPPHKGSDIDIVAVVADHVVIDSLTTSLTEHLLVNPLSRDEIDFHVVTLSMYENASLYGHPSLLLYAHAKEYGQTI
jgi:hypothetical protein